MFRDQGPYRSSQATGAQAQESITHKEVFELPSISEGILNLNMSLAFNESVIAFHEDKQAVEARMYEMLEFVNLIKAAELSRCMVAGPAFNNYGPKKMMRVGFSYTIK